jgi:serine phosphatase RsbU (regulator of sigma subunit)
MINKIILSTVLLFLQFICLGQPIDTVIIIKNESELLNIGKQVYLLEDTEAKMTIDDIIMADKQGLFKKSYQQTPNFNTTESRIWVKFILHNQTNKEVYVELEQANAWYIDFYKPDSTGKPILATQTGMRRPMQNREVANNFFLFELPQKPTPQIYYLSIQSEFPLAIPLLVGTAKRLAEHRYPYIFIFGMFSGLMFIMLFYNLFVYFSVRDITYLYYCGYLLTGLLEFTFISGNYGHQWNIISYFSEYPFVVDAANSISVVMFLVAYLQTKRSSLFFKIMVVYSIITLGFGMTNLITGHYVKVIDALQTCNLLLYLYVFLYSLVLYLKGNAAARFILFGFSFYLFGVIIFILQNFGVLQTNFFTTNAIVLGTSVEVLLFSLALGDRMNTLRREKESTQAALLAQTQENEKIIREQNTILEQKVNEKTRDLQVAYEEIQVTNEELHQTQEEILAQRDVMIEKNEALETYRQKISNSIESALLIQQAILPTSQEIAALCQEYFILYLPKDIVSGDFYWAIQINNHNFFVVADCTGHGVSGAFMTMIGAALLDRIIGVLRIHEPHLILETLHQQIQEVLNQKQTNNTDGMDIAVVKWQKQGANILLNFAAAKRPLYYALPADTQIVKVAGSRKMVGGVRIYDKEFETKNLYLPQGSTIYLSTDGYADQNNKERKKISEKSLLEYLSALQGQSLVQQHKNLLQAVQQHMESEEQRDDILVVGVRL